MLLDSLSDRRSGSVVVYAQDYYQSRDCMFDPGSSGLSDETLNMVQSPNDYDCAQGTLN